MEISKTFKLEDPVFTEIAFILVLSNRKTPDNSDHHSLKKFPKPDSFKDDRIDTVHFEIK